MLRVEEGLAGRPIVVSFLDVEVPNMREYAGLPKPKVAVEVAAAVAVAAVVQTRTVMDLELVGEDTAAAEVAGWVVESL
jgi:hypothetical protein